MKTKLVADLWSDAWRIAGILITALVVLKCSPYIAGALHEPMLETFGVFTGFLLMGAATCHVLRRLLFPNVGMRRAAAVAMTYPTGAGLVFLGICIVLASALLAVRPVQANELPAGARQYLPILIDEQRAHWPDAAMPSVLAAQVEQETCISMTHRFCWSPTAELKTSREYGFGFGQITVTERFNVFDELRSQHASLRHWQWSQRFDPVMQLRALVLKMRTNHGQAKGMLNEWGEMAMAACMYNGGIGGCLADQRLCRATAGCDPSRWTGHIERTSYKARLAVAGYGKSFFQINREYVRNVMGPRRMKYRFMDGAA